MTSKIALQIRLAALYLSEGLNLLAWALWIAAIAGVLWKVATEAADGSWSAVFIAVGLWAASGVLGYIGRRGDA